MPNWIAVEQNTDPWLKAKVGMLSASRFADATSFTQKGKETAARRKLKIQIALERITDRLTEKPPTKAMEWGILNEAEARATFEARTGMIVQLCGIAMHDTIEWLAASPDGLISHDTVWEAKCPMSETHIEYMLGGVVPQEYIPQLQLQCLVTERPNAIFCSYDPRLPEPMDLFVRHYTPTLEELRVAEEQAIMFLNETEEIFEQLTQSTF